MWLYPAASPNLQDVITISVTNKGLVGFTHMSYHGHGMVKSKYYSMVNIHLVLKCKNPPNLHNEIMSRGLV